MDGLVYTNLPYNLHEISSGVQGSVQKLTVRFDLDPKHPFELEAQCQLLLLEETRTAGRFQTVDWKSGKSIKSKVFMMVNIISLYLLSVFDVNEHQSCNQ